MLLCVDIGATKTLMAAFSEEGKLKKEFKFPTPKHYKTFLKEVARAFKAEFNDFDFRASAVAVPALLDRQKGLAVEFGNLSWKNVPIRSDLKDIFGIPVEIENDTKLAGLSEARSVKGIYNKVLYLTVSTGISDALMVNGQIDPALEDSEPGQMIILYEDKLQRWEDFASGHALVAKYGKKASEIDDPEIWEKFSDGLAQGLGQLLAVIQPDVVIIGGGVGTHFDKFAAPLHHALTTKYKARLVEIPPIIKARKPEEAVIYGCYEFIRH